MQFEILISADQSGLRPQQLNKDQSSQRRDPRQLTDASRSGLPVDPSGQLVLSRPARRQSEQGSVVSMRQKLLITLENHADPQWFRFAVTQVLQQRCGVSVDQEQGSVGLGWITLVTLQTAGFELLLKPWTQGEGRGPVAHRESHMA